MAYANEPKQSANILTQVAFKATVDYAIKMGLAVTTDEGYTEFEKVFSRFSESLQNAARSTPTDEALGLRVEANVVRESAEQQIRDNFPGTTDASPQPQQRSSGGGSTVVDGVEIKSWNGKDIPAWAIDGAKRDGVKSLWDNRDDSAGTRKPHFKAADGSKNEKGYPIGYWPPGN